MREEWQALGVLLYFALFAGVSLGLLEVDDDASPPGRPSRGDR